MFNPISAWRKMINGSAWVKMAYVVILFLHGDYNSLHLSTVQNDDCLSVHLFIMVTNAWTLKLVTCLLPVHLSRTATTNWTLTTTICSHVQNGDYDLNLNYKSVDLFRMVTTTWTLTTTACCSPTSCSARLFTVQVRLV